MMLDLSEYSLVWGPIELPQPAYSYADDWDAEIYTPEEIANAILAVPGTSLIHDQTPDWTKWCAEWRNDNHTIRFSILACPFDPDNFQRPGISEYWGGSFMDADCTLVEFLSVWRCIQRACPGVWLHDTDSQMYTPDSFARIQNDG